MTVAFVQKSVELFADAASSIAPSLSGVTAGNHVTMLVACFTDSTYTALAAPSGWSTAESNTSNGTSTYRAQTDIFYKENSSGGTESGTVTLPGASYAAASIIEASGVVTSASLGNHNHNGGNGATASDTSTATSTADCIVYVVTCPVVNAGSITTLSSPASSGYTAIDTNPQSDVHVAYDFSYKLDTSTSSMSGSWTWTTTSDGWQAAIAIFVGPSIVTVNATPGTWTWTGSTGTVVRGPETAFQPNAFQSNAFQIFGGTLGGGGVTTINAGVGAWTWAGSQATTTQLINAGVGAWTWAGSTASTTQLINAGVGAWTWAGAQATTTQLINASPGAWTWAGTQASFAGVTEVNATPGAWSWAGSQAEIPTMVAATPGAWDWAGAQASTTQLINAGIGAFSWAGSQSSFTQLINAGVGTWSWAGTQSQIVQFTTIDSTPGLWNWAGSQSSITTEETGGVTEAGSPFGGRKRREERYIARFKGQDYYFSTLEDLEEFVKQALASEKPKPKKIRKPVRIRLTPVFEEEISQYVEIPARISQLPVSKALEQVRKLDHKLNARVSDDEDDDWLILIA